MIGQAVQIERRGRVTILTIDRPQARNALNASAQYELAAAFDAFAIDDDQWVAILTGTGTRAFCAGHDLQTPPPTGPDELPESGFGGITARFNLEKPVIAAVNGTAVGGGFEMVLACDIVVASIGARFALPEVKVGMAALGGGILRLPQAIGWQRAMGMMLTGQSIDAQEGLQMGFVNEVVATEEVMRAALRWADALLAVSPLALRATKAVALRWTGRPLDAAMAEQWKAPAVARMHRSADAGEGAAAFLAGRAPQWSGR